MIRSDRNTHQNPSTFAWAVLYFIGAAIPIVAIIALVLASNLLFGTYRVLVSYAVVLLVALTIFVTTLGNAVYQGHRFGPRKWIEGIVIGAGLVVAVGVTLRAFLVLQPPPPPQIIPYWLLGHIAILIGVLCYCAMITHTVADEVREDYSDFESVVYLQEQRVHDLEASRAAAEATAEATRKRVEQELNHLEKSVGSALSKFKKPRRRPPGGIPPGKQNAGAE